MMLDLLPEDCFAHILSYASAREACLLSIVSQTTRSMSDSDAVWEKFLSFECREVLSRLDSSISYFTKKELFIRLSRRPHLMDGGKKMFYIEKETSKKCYVLSARELQIEWSNNHLYWSWNTQPFLKSRFEEVAELRTIWWVEIKGIISTKLLSPKTVYFAYLLVKFAERAYGLDSHPYEASIQLNNWRFEHKVYLQKNGAQREKEEEEKWVEIELGKFYVDELGDEEVIMSLKDVKNQHLRGGLIVEGIEIRPKI